MSTAERTQSASGELTLQQRFFRYFQHEITALQEQMERLADRALIAGERSDAADHCLAGITRLSSEVKDASTYLPAYDQRAYSDAIKALQEKFQETRAAYAPKPKFSFKSARKSPSAISLSDAAEMAAQKRRAALGNLSTNAHSATSSVSVTPGYLQTPPNEKSAGNQPVPAAPPPTTLEDNQPLHTPDPVTTTSISISNQSNVHIILPASASRTQTPCSLSRLTSCCLDLSTPSTSTGPFASLTINTATSCLLLCGAVSGPAHITGLKNSVIILTCRQFRMHECHNVDVYLYCSSRPIIEDCKGVRFAELPKAHQEVLASYPDPSHTESSASTITPPENKWDQIDDFKWLKSEPSPNWSILPREDMVPDEIWRDVVPGGPGWSLDDIFRSVGINASSRP